MSILAEHHIGKVCSKCSQRKPLESFPMASDKYGRKYHRGQCKTCYNAYMMAYKRRELSTGLMAQIEINRLWKPIGIEA